LSDKPVKLEFVFDDGVELVIEDVPQSTIVDFVEYQWYDPQMTSEFAGRIIDWFFARGFKAKVGVSDKVSIWNPWRLVCLYRAWKLRKKYLL